jgi:antitoxin VapB
MVDIDGRQVEPMSLNIKNEEAHRLARELARATGESMTVAVSEAIRERLERVRSKSKKGMAEKLMKIARETGPLWKKPHVSIEELLYDENGLPKGLLK